MDLLDQCPFLDDDDPRCSRVLRRERISDAFQFCVGGYDQCPIYRIMMRARKDHPRVRPTAAAAQSA